ncbi:BREX-1 system adenine-specific DNA-methyltransferase PglX [Photobacterium phosphoreum]|uniref:BREX-1 system adenine-specific DNA-methyltransferase PglX n=1 Tax=Photobacterium phosphoreum TaxID=659 RepID=UPI001E5FC8A6|nr:BREX-1 system adenine-specific DNA-methyltransferase PglX [Photobacterium phosphoreum]MCD9472598.1 restriction endonuclease subunit M [Photobacterium phosphoreum]
MRKALDKALRKKLEDTVVKARDIVEVAVVEVLQRLGVSEAQAPSYLTEEERTLRNQLRAHARQLGDKLNEGKQEIECLVNEMAYAHWHRMLFARFLEQNNLLMYEGTSVTLDECSELAEEEPDCKDGWELAGRLAQKMLPQIFRVDSPVFAVKFSINHLVSLEKLIKQLDPQTYYASDALGWSYQFWQLKKKKEINAAEVKIDAGEISPVTQLFTEPYMVQSLLDNSFGAWWFSKVTNYDDYVRSRNEKEIKSLVSSPQIPLDYLRLIHDKTDGFLTPAAGLFSNWPQDLKDFKAIDPCCGSGHFLVSLFLMLVPARMKLETINVNDAIDKVLSENIFGLELDRRCVEIAVFALALEAWRYPNAGGFRKLPTLNIAWAGFDFDYNKETLNEVSKSDIKLYLQLQTLFDQLKDAPVLGSLIDPIDILMNDDISLSNVLDRIKLIQKQENQNKESVFASTDVYTALTILSGKYHLVATNPPYLTKNKQSKRLLNYCSDYYQAGVADLATVFFKRYRNFLLPGGAHIAVTPLNWLFIKSYSKLRKDLSHQERVRMITKVGSGATAKDSWDVLRALTIITKEHYQEDGLVAGIDVTEVDENGRAEQIKNEIINIITYSGFLNNPDSRFVVHEREIDTNIEDLARSFAGLQSGDYPRFGRKFWEIEHLNEQWTFQQSTFDRSSNYLGSEHIFRWEQGLGSLANSPKAYVRGLGAHGKRGVVVTQTRSLPVTTYLGGFFDNNVAVIIPEDKDDLSALWSYCQSKDYHVNVRKLDEKLGVTNATLAKVPFDKVKWGKIAKTEYPNGLPQPYSDAPTQWIFHGHPCASVVWDEETKTTAVGQFRQDDTVLQVAVARLLGYQWPAELDADMELAPEMREVMKKNADFAGLIDDDGIVCIPAVRGEKNAAKRLEAILVAAYGNEWNNSVDSQLLKAVKAKDWESWLRDKFFEQHSKMFQHRPFIWQIWDGVKDGFSALVNYHKLDYKGLERLIYTYLDDWISSQKRDVADGVDGADIRLTAAENLKIQLEAILEGEKGLDIFVRWKPLTEQPIGWNPDLNDGVRLNIRPLMSAKDVGKKGAGVLRAKPNVHWKKDRGTDVASAPWFDLGLEYGGKQGDRINEHHLSLADKKVAQGNN